MVVSVPYFFSFAPILCPVRLKCASDFTVIFAFFSYCFFCIKKATPCFGIAIKKISLLCNRQKLFFTFVDFVKSVAEFVARRHDIFHPVFLVQNFRPAVSTVKVSVNHFLNPVLFGQIGERCVGVIKLERGIMQHGDNLVVFAFQFRRFL